MTRARCLDGRVGEASPWAHTCGEAYTAPSFSIEAYKAPSFSIEAYTAPSFAREEKISSGINKGGTRRARDKNAPWGLLDGKELEGGEGEARG